MIDGLEVLNALPIHPSVFAVRWNQTSETYSPQTTHNRVAPEIDLQNFDRRWRVKTGIDGLDELLQGGFSIHTTTVPLLFLH